MSSSVLLSIYLIVRLDFIVLPWCPFKNGPMSCQIGNSCPGNMFNLIVEYTNSRSFHSSHVGRDD